ncbi:MAG TPA: CBS domain-containing protein [Anaeromyxobacteraceae bacterium]|nr:CBS domain-containing protein [Anaeromyxobacteraceae bacterium]
MPATARDLLAEKNSSVVYTIGAEASVLEACRVMLERRIGSLLVTREARVEGIFTEWDVLARVVAAGRDPSATRVAEVMSPDVVMVPPDEPIHRMEQLMRVRRFRHLPVMGERGLLGILSIGDVAAWRAHPGAVAADAVAEGSSGI